MDGIYREAGLKDGHRRLIPATPVREHFVAKWNRLALQNCGENKTWSVSAFP
jgi:hypothetical protein